MRTRILGYTSNHSMIAASDVNTLLDNEHQEILESRAWSQRKEDDVIETVATYTTGTVEGSSGSATITGTSTVWTSGMVNRYIRIGSNTFFHRITAVASGTSLTIEDTLPAAVAAGATYTIFQHRYNLASNFGRAISVTSDVKLTETDILTLDRLDPYRSGTATRPDRFCIFGLDPNTTASQIYQIELYPVSSSATSIRVLYYKTNTLAADTDEPLYRSDVLVWKGSEAACFFLHAKTGDTAWLALADRYHLRYLEALEGAINDDLAKSSPIMHVRDAYLEDGHSDDYALNHDLRAL